MRAWTIAFALGVGLASLVPALPPGWSLVSLGVLVLAALARPRLRLAGIYGLGLLWGLWWALQGMALWLPAALEREDIWVRGQVVSLPQQAAYAQRFTFRVDRLCPRAGLGQCRFGELPRERRRILLNDYQGLGLRPGQRWQLQVRLKRPHGFANPGGFDYEAWLLQQRIGATGYVRPAPDNRLLEQGGRWSFLALRAGFRSRLDQMAGLRQGGLIKALTIGERYDISNAQWDLFSATGTNHLMVISGLHVGLVAALAYRLAVVLAGLLPRMLLVVPAPRSGAAAAVLAAFFYSALAGFSLPTQRAFLMVLALMAGRLLGRVTHALDGFTLALGLVLVLDPLAPQSTGFWLSFGAVAVLLALAQRESGAGAMAWTARGRQLVQAQLWLFLGMLPLMLIFFGQTSLLAPLVNLLAIPLVSLVVVPLCLLGLVLLWAAPGLAGLAFVLADYLLDRLLAVLALLAGRLPQAVLELPVLPQWGEGLLILGVALLLAAPRRLRLAAPLCFMPLVWTPEAALPAGSFRLHVLDVGQGLAVLVETRAHSLVYDAGPAYSERFNAGAAVLLPFLRQRQVRRLDAVVISHGDNDHAGGLGPLALRHPRARYYSGEPGELSPRVGAEPCQAGQSWRWDGVEFSFLHPRAGEAGWSGNNASCVLRIASAGHAALLPGDVEARVERRLLERAPGALRADVLVAPHHGSKTSSGAAFVAAVDPHWVIFSAGYLSRFNHPHPDVQARYRRQGAAMLNTAHSGALSITISPQGVGAPRPWRQARRRYWSLMSESYSP